MESAAQVFANGLNCFHELLAIELRNMEAIGQAQQKMMEGMGALARHQAEMAESAMQRAFGTQPHVPTTPAAIHTAVVGQIDWFKTAIMEGQANSNVLSELAARSSGDVANILQSRMLAALDEVKVALDHAVPEKISTIVPTPAALETQPVAQA